VKLKLTVGSDGPRKQVWGCGVGFEQESEEKDCERRQEKDAAEGSGIEYLAVPNVGEQRTKARGATKKGRWRLSPWLCQMWESSGQKQEEQRRKEDGD
jgi:hypothetical protein